MLKVIFTVLLLTVLCGGFALSEDVRGVAAVSTPQEVWDNFLAALRKGDMKSAYDYVMPYSRREMTYRDFCASWHPLSFRYESVLTPPGFSEFRISGDIATLRLGLRQEPGEEQGHITRAAMIRDDGRWWVVDGPNTTAALAEASARNIVARLIGGSRLVRQALHSGQNIRVEDLKRENPRFFEESSVLDFFSAYTLEIDVLRDGVLRARPRHPGLRGYSAGLDGRVVAFNSTPPARVTGEDIQRQELARKEKEQQAIKLEQQRLKREQDTAAKARAVSQALSISAKLRENELDPVIEDVVITAKPALSLNSSSHDNIPPPAPVFGDPDKGGELPALQAQAAKISKPRNFDNLELPEFDDASDNNTFPVSKPAVVSKENLRQSSVEDVRKFQKDDKIKPVDVVEGKVIESKVVSGNSVWQKEVIDIEVPGISAISIAQDENVYGTTVIPPPDKLKESDSAVLEKIIADFPH